MSAEFDSGAQAAELGIRFDQESVTIKGLLVAYHLLKSQPDMPEGATSELDDKLGSIASMIGETIGVYVDIDGTRATESVVSEAVEQYPGRHVEQEFAAAITARNAPRRAGQLHPDYDAAGQPSVHVAASAVVPLPDPPRWQPTEGTPETTDRPVAIEQFGEESVVINGHEVRLTKYDKQTLHALAFVNGDHVTAEDIRLIIRATTPYDVPSTAKYLKLSLERLARRITRELGYGVIECTEASGPSGSVYRYGLVNTPGSSYATDIKPPVTSTDVPYLVKQGEVRGSLFSGIIDMENAPLTIPDDPIMIEVLSDNVLYIREGREGRAVNIQGNNLFVANALLAIGGMIQRGQVKTLAARTGEASLSQIVKTSIYVDFLRRLLGTANGQDIIVKSNEGSRDMAYGFNANVMINDRRGTGLHKVAAQLVTSDRAGLEAQVESTNTVAAVVEPDEIAPVGTDPGLDEAAAGNAEPEAIEAIEAGDVKHLYNAAIEAYEQTNNAESQSQVDVERSIADDLGTDVPIVRYMLVLHRLGRELGVSLEPADDVDAAGFSEHVQRVHAWADELLRSVTFLNPRSRLSELNIFAMHLGLTPDIPCLQEREVTLPNRNATYGYAASLVRDHGLAFSKMHKVLIAHEDAIEQTYQRALTKVRAQLEQS